MGCTNYLGHATTAPLQLNAAGDVITFTPRPDFIGRATFAFHLSDGIERGSFIVVNVDVTKEKPFFQNYPDDCELVINGSFEEGTEYNRYNYSSGVYTMPAEVDNSGYMLNYTSGNGVASIVLNPGIGLYYACLLADGSENIQYGLPAQLNNVDSYTPTYCSQAFWSYFPGLSLTYPLSGVAPSLSAFPYPSPLSPSPSNRYRVTLPQVGSAVYSEGENNLTLHNRMINGALYEVRFDYNFWGLRGNFAAESLMLCFTNKLNGGPGVFSYGSVLPTDKITMPISYTSFSTSAPFGAWARYSSQFTYTGATGNQFMRIAYDPVNPVNLAKYFMTDNVSLRRIIIPAYTTSVSGGVTTVVASVPGNLIVAWQWYNNGVLIPGATSNVYSYTNAGNYSVVATDENGCTGSAPLVPCPTFNQLFSTTGVNILPTSLTGSNPPVTGVAYYVQGAVTVTGSTLFQNNYLLMAQGASITVNNGAQLVIDHSHLATCPDSSIMWQGITLGTDWGYVLVKGSSLIEDADRAISSINAANRVAPGGALPLIETNEAIFNRNRYAIFIDNDPTNYNRYLFKNTVFTSRYLHTSIYTPSTLTFTNWPSAASLKASSGPAYAPYVLSSTYTKADCKDGTPGLAGIYLNLVGTTAITSGSANTYNDLKAGDETATQYRNLYDYLRAGIEAHNTNLAVRNSTFLNGRSGRIPATTSGGGDGVYADATAVRHLSVENGASQKGAGTGNAFFENQYGVEAFDIYNAHVNNATFTSTNTSASFNAISPVTNLPCRGFGAIGMTNSIGYEVQEANANTIDNALYGIVLRSNVPPSRILGKLIAQENHISLPSSAGATHNSNQGILAEQLFSFTNTTSYPAAWAVIQGNILTNLYNGITVSGFHFRPAIVDHNTITLQTAPSQLRQDAILMTANSDNPYVTNNTITGGGRVNQFATGVRSSFNAFMAVLCNNEQAIDRGFEFSGPSSGCQWLANTMQNNGIGFLLSNGAALGDQPFNGSFTGLGCNDSWASWPAGGPWQTYVAGAHASNTRLFVWNTPSRPDLMPTINGQSAIIWTKYASPWLPSATSLFASCGVTPWPVTWHPRLVLHEQVAQNTIHYGCSDSLRQWLTQMQLYRSVAATDTMRDSSAILLSFYNTAASTRFAWLSAIEDSLASGNDAAAAALLAAGAPSAGGLPGTGGVYVSDGHRGDSVVANYVTFYGLYLRWKGGTFSTADSVALESLADLCPPKDGQVVYQARTLLHFVTGYAKVYNDQCDEVDAGGQARRAPVEIARQQYSLSPNPTDGLINLQQAMPDESSVQITVYNSIGSKVFGGSRIFESGQASLTLKSLPAGLYHLVIRDSKGDKYSLKFVKQ